MRARQRQIILMSYQLASGSKLQRRPSGTGRLKKVVVKVKMAVASLVVSFMKVGGGLRSSCISKVATYVSSPVQISRFC
ncbi:unnamed protein product [Linum tenue]|uniref:Uncharacterized protein n=1 Tax=Linum tenue TaxID=586396 RepID=A0AAV0NQQ8_9ROSI|nr:unnamed protein product [Linum tenue]